VPRDELDQLIRQRRLLLPIEGQHLLSLERELLLSLLGLVHVHVAALEDAEDLEGDLHEELGEDVQEIGGGRGVDVVQEAHEEEAERVDRGPQVGGPKEVMLEGGQLGLECKDFVLEGFSCEVSAQIGHILECPIVDIDLFEDFDVGLNLGHDPDREYIGQVHYHVKLFTIHKLITLLSDSLECELQLSLEVRKGAPDSLHGPEFVIHKGQRTVFPEKEEGL